MYKKLGRDSTSLWSTLQHPLQRYGCRWPLNDKHLPRSLGLNHVLLFKITIISLCIFLLFLFIFYGTHLELVLQSYVLTKIQPWWDARPGLSQTRPLHPWNYCLWQDLSDEMQNSYGVKPGRFRQLFNQTLQQQLGMSISVLCWTQVTFKGMWFWFMLPNRVWIQLMYWYSMF